MRKGVQTNFPRGYFCATFPKSCFGSQPLFKKVVQNFGSTFPKGRRLMFGSTFLKGGYNKLQ